MADLGLLRRATVTAAVVGALVATWPAAAGADEVSRDELARLARQAADDPRALERLRGVDRVDGRPVDLRQALDAPAPQAMERARLLAEGSAGPRPGAGAEAAARQEAEEILAQRRFHPRRFPRPLAGLLRRIGGWFEPVGERIGGWLQPLAERIGDLVESLGGRTTVLAILAGVVVVLAAVVAARLARRRTAANVTAARSARRPTRASPEELERRADAAEREGQLDHAFRLRFEAGLVRLHDAGRLRLRPSLTTGEVVRRVPSPTLGQLAATLEEIVYGGRPAAPPDLNAARSGWPRVLEEAGS